MPTLKPDCEAARAAYALGSNSKSYGYVELQVFHKLVLTVISDLKDSDVSTVTFEANLARRVVHKRTPFTNPIAGNTRFVDVGYNGWCILSR